MSERTVLDDWLDLWEDLQEQGEGLPLDQFINRFCNQASPHLVAQLRAKVSSLRAMDGRLAEARASRSTSGHRNQDTADASGAGSRFRPGQEPVPGYRLQARLGKGGFGEVWKGTGPGDFPVALKFVRLDPRFGAREQQALETIKKVHHPHLLAIFGYWEIDGYLVIAMELADQTLLDRLREAQAQGHAGIPRAELLEYLAEAAKGLDCLHGVRFSTSAHGAAGLQHQDIKPANLLLSGGSVKVADFSLVRSLDHSLTRHTGGSTLVFAAPEVFEGKTSTQADQYSLAVTYCELCGGRLPFTGNEAQIMHGHLKGRPDLSMLPLQDRSAVARALAKQPRDRWPSCGAFVTALRHATPTGSPGNGTGIDDALPHRPPGRLFGSFVAVSILLFGVGAVWLWNRPDGRGFTGERGDGGAQAHRQTDAAGAKQPKAEGEGKTPAVRPVSADDFLPAVQGGPTEVKQPGQVVVKKDRVKAATAQDAVNVAVGENKKERKGGTEPSIGVRLVEYPGGLGIVATGMAGYRGTDNTADTRIAQRQAFVIAFTQAKKGLAEYLGGLSTESKETIRQSLTKVNLSKEEMENVTTRTEESLTQAADMLLRGFEIYEVHHDAKQHLVAVSIASTPTSRGRHARSAGHAVEVDDLRQGLTQVIDEVRSGVVPPVGGRIILLRKTGELAFVGFGSSVVRGGGNEESQAKLDVEAQKIAAMRAKDSLCGLVIGDRTAWKGSVVESLQDAVREFESLKADDPLALASPAQVQKLERARQAFVAKIETEEVYTSARKGILPPGITTKTWFDDDRAWAFAMSVYIPSLSKATADAAREMLAPSPEGGPKDKP